MRTHLTVPGWARQGAVRARGASSTVQRRLSGVTYPPRTPELDGHLIPLDTTAWDGVVRTSQTPAFRVALIAALSVAWIGTATLSGAADGHPPTAADGQPDGPPISMVEPVRSADPPVIAAPPDAKQEEESDDFSRNYAKIAAELDQQASRGELSVYANTAPPPSLCPACTDSPPLPGPVQTPPNVPPATVDDPAASPTPTSVEEPSPQATVTTPSQPVPAASIQPTTEQPATTNQPAPAATAQPTTEQPVTTNQPAPAATAQPTTEQPVIIQPTVEQGSGPAAGPAS